jgi:hypothetical protein
MTRQYPLVWPENEPRTPPGKKRTVSPFMVTPDRALRHLYDELRRFKARDVILSSNVAVRNDGMLYADAMRRRIDDPAVALYFTIGARNISVCCDIYDRVDDNIRAIGKIIEAMRTIERYGGQHLSEKSFTGFLALPPPPDCWKTLGISKGVGEGLSNKLRRAKEGHGAGKDMAALTEARDQALQELGVA